MIDGKVYLWQIDLDAIPGDAAFECLDDHEQRRANLRRSPRDRHRFIATHVALRMILANLLGTYPSNIAFEETEHRKPLLAHHMNPERWQFNVARSGASAVIAVTKEQRIGIDLELAAQTYDELRDAAQGFTNEEKSQLNMLPIEEAARAFYRCWTRKEAVLKAIGIGILEGMNSFKVDLHTGATQTVRTFSSSGEPEKWTVIGLDDLEADAPYSSALAIETDTVTIFREQLPAF